MSLVRLAEAARELAVSVPTLKQWIYRGKVRSVKTAGGHHRIPRLEIDRLLFRQVKAFRREKGLRVRTLQADPGAQAAGLEHLISGRNQLVGRITALRTMGLLTKVTLNVGGQRVTAIITQDACRDLRLKVGETAAALIKATEVMIIRSVPRKD